jgi:hypothetical protein
MRNPYFEGLSNQDPLRTYWGSTELEWDTRQHRGFAHHLWSTLAHDWQFWLIGFVTFLPRMMTRLLRYIEEPSAEHLADVGSILLQFTSLLIVVALISRRDNRLAHAERTELLVQQPDLFSRARAIRETLVDPAEIRWARQWAFGAGVLLIIGASILALPIGNMGFVAAIVVGALWALLNAGRFTIRQWDDEAFRRAREISAATPPAEGTLAQWRLS